MGAYFSTAKSLDLVHRLVNRRVIGHAIHIEDLSRRNVQQLPHDLLIGHMLDELREQVVDVHTVFQRRIENIGRQPLVLGRNTRLAQPLIQRDVGVRAAHGHIAQRVQRQLARVHIRFDRRVGLAIEGAALAVGLAVIGAALAVRLAVIGAALAVGPAVIGAALAVGLAVIGAALAVGLAIEGAAFAVGLAVIGAALAVGPAVIGAAFAVGLAIETAALAVGLAVEGAALAVGLAIEGAAFAVGLAIEGAALTVGLAVKISMVAIGLAGICPGFIKAAIAHCVILSLSKIVPTGSGLPIR